MTRLRYRKRSEGEPLQVIPIVAPVAAAAAILQRFTCFRVWDHMIDDPEKSAASDDPVMPRGERLRAEVRSACAQFIVLVFVVAITLPLLGAALHWDPWPSQEKRRLAPWPAIPKSWNDAREFPAGFMAYFRDHFGFRNALIHQLAVVRPREFNLFSNSRAIIGKEGWLYFRDPEDWDLQSYLGLAPLSQDELAAWQALHEHRQA
jgi:hypothetical protein